MVEQACGPRSTIICVSLRLPMTVRQTHKVERSIERIGESRFPNSGSDVRRLAGFDSQDRAERCQIVRIFDRRQRAQVSRGIVVQRNQTLHPRPQLLGTHAETLTPSITLARPTNDATSVYGNSYSNSPVGSTAAASSASVKNTTWLCSSKQTACRFA